MREKWNRARRIEGEYERERERERETDRQTVRQTKTNRGGGGIRHEDREKEKVTEEVNVAKPSTLTSIGQEHRTSMDHEL